jgi:hypothetical protein
MGGSYGDNIPVTPVPSFPFRDHIVRRPEPDPDWAMFEIEGKRAVSWTQFKEMIADSCDMVYGVVE